MRLQVQKWGKGLALRIPACLASEAKLKDGAVVELTTVDGKLVVSPIHEGQETLDTLLAGVTRENLHREFDTGRAAGREAW